MFAMRFHLVNFKQNRCIYCLCTFLFDRIVFWRVLAKCTKFLRTCPSCHGLGGILRDPTIEPMVQSVSLLGVMRISACILSTATDIWKEVWICASQAEGESSFQPSQLSASRNHAPWERRNQQNDFRILIFEPLFMLSPLCPLNPIRRWISFENPLEGSCRIATNVCRDRYLGVDSLHVKAVLLG